MGYAAMTHTGSVREINEDDYYADGSLFIVADGMGGHQAGEVASSLAIETFIKRLGESMENGQDVLELMAAAAREANATIREQSRRDPAKEGMGTTFTAALLRGGELLIVHVGDSRAYLFQGDRLARLTRDHSLVEDMVRRGSLKPSEARTHPHRNIIIRALGIEEQVEVDQSRMGLPEHGLLLLCTDGLCGELSDEEIAAVMREWEASGSDLSSLAERLVEAALEAGGNDNVTVVLAELKGAGEGGFPAGAPKEEGLRGEPSTSDSRRWRPLLLGLTAVLFILLLALLIFVPYVKNHSYYVGIDGEGKIALYRGLPYKPLGISMSEIYDTSLAPAENLPPEKQERLRRPQTKDLAGAEREFKALVREAESGVRVPDFRGMTWEEALSLAERHELQLRSRGAKEPRPDQEVLWQDPAPGELADKLDIIYVELREGLAPEPPGEEESLPDEAGRKGAGAFP